MNYKPNQGPNMPFVIAGCLVMVAGVIMGFIAIVLWLLLQISQS